MRFGIVATVLVVCARIGHAESGEELRIRGESLAKDGRYSEAIDAFKAAERLEHRSRHACLIGLAFERREAWSQAEVYLADCKAGASSSDPLPEWAPEAGKVLAEALAREKLVAVTVTSNVPDVTITVSAFATDDRFTPRAIHLAKGTYTITASAPGRVDATRSITVADAPITVALEPAVPAVHSPSKLPWVLIGGGVAAGIAGGLVQAIPMKHARDALADATAAHDKTTYDRWSPRFDRDRLIAIGLYGVATVAIVTGVILKVTDSHDETHPVAIVPTDGGAMLTFGWIH